MYVAERGGGGGRFSRVCAAEREDSVECVCRERGRGLLRECMWQKGRELGESVADYPSLSVLKTQNVIIDL